MEYQGVPPQIILPGQTIAIDTTTNANWTNSDPSVVGVQDDVGAGVAMNVSSGPSSGLSGYYLAPVFSGTRFVPDGVAGEQSTAS